MAKNSAYTSTRQVPAAFTNDTLANVFEGGHNLDWGGGKFDDARNWLACNRQCTSDVYDPFNRPMAHNLQILLNARSIVYSSISCLNVLNVITDAAERAAVLESLAMLAKDIGTVKYVVLQVYEGDSSGTPGKGRVSQNNQKLAWYLPDIQKFFPELFWKYQVTGDKKNILLLTLEQT